ncbi:MAG: fibronectin type III domain-containing protein [Lachnospiraceae bacterium]|nr:fibronectin type III domain-containing protein [Lachnospiraceae bacterium]
MSKKRLLSALLAVLMVFGLIPLDSIKVQAGLQETGELTYSGSEVTGYSGSDISTVKRIIIPESATSIAAGALNSSKLPALKEVAVLNDNITIGENAFGKYNDGATNTNVTVWCNKGSKAEEYAVRAGLPIGYLNVRDLEIDSSYDTYFTGCEPFDISTVIQAGSNGGESADIIWQTSNIELAWFQDENGNKVTESQGTITPNSNGTNTSTVKVYVCDNIVRKSGQVTITATCRGTGEKDTKVYTIEKATTTITPVIKLYRPASESVDERGSGKIEATDTGEKDPVDNSTLINVVYEEVPESELQKDYFINNTLYIDSTWIYSIRGLADDDCNDVIDISGNTNLLLSQCKLDNTTVNGTCKVKSVLDKDGNPIIGSFFYAGEDNSITLGSQNNTLTRVINVKVCKKAYCLASFKMISLTGEGDYTFTPSNPKENNIYENTFEMNPSVLSQSRYKLEVNLLPVDHTDEVTWTSNNDTVAKIVDGNNLEINSSGTAKLTCTINDSKSGKRGGKFYVNLTVNQKVQYKKIVFAKDENRDTVITSKNLALGESWTPVICDSRNDNGEIYIPGDNETAANEPVIYTSSNTQIAQVNNGVITASGINTGLVTITATAPQSGVSSSIALKVYAPAVQIDVPTSIRVPVGQTMEVPYSLSPATATEDVEWISGNASIAVGEDYINENGERFLKLNGKSIGDTTLTGRTLQTGVNNRINVTVEPAVHADEVSMDLINDDISVTTDADGDTVYNLPKGKTMYLKPNLKSSSGATPNDQIQWFVESGSDTVCDKSMSADYTVSFTGKAAGKISVTLKAVGGDGTEKQVKAYINVYVPATEIDIRINNSITDIYTVEVGAVSTLTGVFKPSDSTDSITWSVTDNDNNVELTKSNSLQNEAVAMTALKVGTVHLKAQADSGVVDEVTIRVIKPATSIKFVQDGQEVDTGYVTWKGEKTISLNVLDEDTTDTTFTWGSVQDNGLLRITPNADGKSAVIEGLAPGMQQIKVTAPSGKTATLNVNVVVPAEKIELNNTELSVYKGDPAINVVATLSPSNTTDVVKWSVDKEGIVTITPDTANTTSEKKAVKIQGIEAGVVNVTATTVDGLKQSIQITVNAKDVDITTVADIPAQTYSGREITPSFAVVNGNVSLRKDVDYTVSYKNNINAGTATIVIEGIGNYAGTKEIPFEIVPKNISSVQNGVVTAEEYNGKEHKPDIKLTDSGSGTAVELVNGKDYSIEYTNNISVGVATAKFTGKGNYMGEKTVSFQITAKNINESKDITIEPIKSMTYTGSALIPDVVVKDGTKVLEKDKDYVVSFANNVNAGTATVTITGRGNYNSNKTSSFTINKRSLSKAKFAAIPNQNYTGKAIEPYVSVTVSDRTLSLNTDYKVKYSNNKKPGKATIKITGMGNYSSSATKTFVILPLVPSNPKMSSNTSSSVTLKWSKATGATGYYVYEYNASKGKPSKKVATVTKNTATIKKLSAGTDKVYSIYSYVKVGSKTYKSAQYVNVSAGTATKTPAIKKLTTAGSSVQLTWKSVKGATGYTIYYATSKKGKYKKFGDVSGLTANVTGLKAKRTYYFKIRTYRNIGGKLYYSSYSSVKSKKVKA